MCSIPLGQIKLIRVIRSYHKYCASSKSRSHTKPPHIQENHDGLDRATRLVCRSSKREELGHGQENLQYRHSFLVVPSYVGTFVYLVVAAPNDRVDPSAWQFTRHLTKK